MWPVGFTGRSVRPEPFCRRWRTSWRSNTNLRD